MVELSIVLVVIGLILGGVTVGNDLINASKLRSSIAAIEQYRTAVRMFQDKYNLLPGDLSASSTTKFGFTAPTGPQWAACSEDGLIEDVYCNNPPYILAGESAVFWTHLTEAKLIKGKYTPPISAPGGGITGGINLPILPVGGSIIVQTDGTGKNWFGTGINDVTSGTSYTANSAKMLTTDAYAIDKKVDDGMPNTGTVQATAIYNSGGTNVVAPIGATATSCAQDGTPAATYMVTSGGKRCNIRFELQ